MKQSDSFEYENNPDEMNLQTWNGNHMVALNSESRHIYRSVLMGGTVFDVVC